MFISYKDRKTELDHSLHSGVPRQFSHLKNKEFGDWEIPPWELYIFFDKKIGEGTYASVYLSKWRETIVVSKIFKDNVDKELILREINIMSKIHHPNIVQFLGFIDEPFIIIMEYIPNGNLSNKIVHLSNKKKLKIMTNILQGLAYLHERKPNMLIHRDIKSTNILLTNSYVAKIADFGLSKFYYKENKNSKCNLQNMDNDNSNTESKIESNNVGTERYMAPEVKNKLMYSSKIDIYSTGILLYEMFENKYYLSNFNWFWCPKKIKYIIINYMLNENPNNRKTALNILKILNK